MSRRARAALALPAAAVLVLAACSSTAHPAGSASSAKAAITSSPQFQAARQVWDTCLARQGGLTALASKAHQRTFETCVVPPGHVPALKACLLADLGSAHLLSHKGREAFAIAGITCVERNR